MITVSSITNVFSFYRQNLDHGGGGGGSGGGGSWGGSGGGGGTLNFNDHFKKTNETFFVLSKI